MSKTSWVPSPRSSSPSQKRTQDVSSHYTGRGRILNADTAAFDPKPFIRTFEAAVDKLIAVRKDVQAKSEQMEKSVRVAERDYSKKMAELNRGFEVCRSVLALYFSSYVPIACLVHIRQSGRTSPRWRRR